MSFPVIAQQHARWIDAVTTRPEAATDEQTDRAITVEVSCHATGAAGELRWKRVLGFPEISVAVIQVQAILKRRRPLAVFTAAADDVQIGEAVAVRVEEDGAKVFGDGILLEDPVAPARKRSV